MTPRQARAVLKSLAEEFRLIAAQGDLRYYEISLFRNALRAKHGFRNETMLQEVEKAFVGVGNKIVSDMDWTPSEDGKRRLFREISVARENAAIDDETYLNLAANACRAMAHIPEMLIFLDCKPLSKSFDSTEACLSWIELLRNMADTKQHPVIRLIQHRMCIGQPYEDTPSGLKFAPFRFGDKRGCVMLGSMILCPDDEPMDVARLQKLSASRNTWVRTFESGILRTSAHAIEWLLDPAAKSSAFGRFEEQPDPFDAM